MDTFLAICLSNNGNFLTLNNGTLITGGRDLVIVDSAWIPKAPNDLHRFELRCLYSEILLSSFQKEGKSFSNRHGTN